MKIIYELDDATDSQSDIAMMAHVRDYVSALHEIDRKIRAKLKYCDVYSYGDSKGELYGEKFTDTIENLRQKNEELIQLLEDVRCEAQNTMVD